jgi:ribonuclease HI
MSEKIIIYTDGGSRNNPGIAGAGAVIANGNGEILKKASKALGIMTNNEAEYEAVLLGIETAKKLLGKEKLKHMTVEVRLDSELVARQLSDEYQIKEERLFPYFIKIHNIMVSEIPNLLFVHIPREKNKEADALANMAMDSQSEKLF